VEIVPYNLAVAPYFNRLPGQGAMKNCGNQTLSFVWRLPGAIRVGNAEHVKIEVMKALIKGKVLFDGQFGDAVGRDRVRRGTLVDDRLRLRNAIDGAPGRGKYNLAYPFRAAEVKKTQSWYDVTQ